MKSQRRKRQANNTIRFFWKLNCEGVCHIHADSIRVDDAYARGNFRLFSNLSVPRQMQDLVRVSRILPLEIIIIDTFKPLNYVLWPIFQKYLPFIHNEKICDTD